MLSRLLFAVLALLALAGCATVDTRQEYATLTDAQPLEARYYHVDIPMRDGIIIRATVYQPELAPGKTAPLVISAHGFGGFRTSGPVSLYGQFIITGEATLNAWKHGYWVVSYDQRGFGQSGGKVSMMNPAWEPRDLSEVITWANRNLPRLTRQSPDDPVLGTVGESWGGGVQLMTSFVDPRIDAMVPVTTWNNLPEAFAPNDAVRSYWGLVLVLAGTFSSGFDFPQVVTPPYSTMFGGEMNVGAKASLELSSPSHYCDQGKAPQADMLLIQGFEDTLMPINHAVKNQACALKGGRDARLVAIQSGHRLLWPVQSLNGFPMFHTDPRVKCGKFDIGTLDMVQQWFDLKLKGIPEPTPIPQTCVTLPDDVPGVTPDAVAVGGREFKVPESHVKLVQSGWFEVVMSPLDRLVSLGIPTSDHVELKQESPRGGWFRPYFVPLWVAPARTPVAGIPKARLDMENTSDDNKDVVFASVGIRRNGSIAIDVLSDQYTPVVGNGPHELTMQGVSGVLEKGDTLGIVLQGFTGQYFFNPEGWMSTAHVSGAVQIPLLPAQ